MYDAQLAGTHSMASMMCAEYSGTRAGPFALQTLGFRDRGSSFSLFDISLSFFVVDAEHRHRKSQRPPISWMKRLYSPEFVAADNILFLTGLNKGGVQANISEIEMLLEGAEDYGFETLGTNYVHVYDGLTNIPSSVLVSRGYHRSTLPLCERDVQHKEFQHFLAWYDEKQ